MAKKLKISRKKTKSSDKGKKETKKEKIKTKASVKKKQADTKKKAKVKTLVKKKQAETKKKAKAKDLVKKRQTETKKKAKAKPPVKKKQAETKKKAKAKPPVKKKQTDIKKKTKVKPPVKKKQTDTKKKTKVKTPVKKKQTDTKKKTKVKAFVEKKKSTEVDTANKTEKIASKNISSSFISIPKMPVYKGKYILYASGNLNISSIKNSEFFVLFYANVKTKKRKSFDVKLNGIIKIFVPSYEVSAENKLFEWLEKTHKEDRILEDREKKWTKKIIQAIASFSSSDNKYIKKIEINWKYIEKYEKFTKVQTKILKSLFKVGYNEYDGENIQIDNIKTNNFKPNLRIIKSTISKNPLPLLIPTYRFIDENENSLVENSNILELIPRR